jgi:3-hydroxyisobutyrate dehydrogenase
MSTARVGFIGLGAMGTPMARRLLGQGFPVVGCANVRRESVEQLKGIGLVEASSPAAVALDADVVITMVRDGRESEAVILGSAGALAAMRAGSVLVIMSTIAPDLCRRVAALAAPRQVDVLDAPVSGFPWRAAEGALALMVGGEAPVVERVRPVLEAMGRIFPCGAVGMGMVAKLANNAVVMGTAALLLEARAFAGRHGMPDARLLEIFAHASAASFVVENWAAIRAIWDHVLGLVLKDAGICLESAAANDVPMPLTAAARAFDWAAHR